MTNKNGSKRKFLFLSNIGIKNYLNEEEENVTGIEMGPMKFKEKNMHTV